MSLQTWSFLLEDFEGVREVVVAEFKTLMMDPGEEGSITDSAATRRDVNMSNVQLKTASRITKNILPEGTFCERSIKIFVFIWNGELVLRYRFDAL